MRTRLSVGLAGLAVAGSLVLPIVASAQTLLNTLALVSTFLNSAVYLLITLAIIFFFWGLAQYILNEGEDKKKGLDRMLMGILAIFVMVSIWGIIRLLQNTFRVNSTEPIIPKTIQLNTSGTY